MLYINICLGMLMVMIIIGTCTVLKTLIKSYNQSERLAGLIVLVIEIVLIIVWIGAIQESRSINRLLKDVEIQKVEADR